LTAKSYTMGSDPMVTLDGVLTAKSHTGMMIFVR